MFKNHRLLALTKQMPKVVCPLVGEDGNAFAVMGRWQRAAKRAGWTPELIEMVLTEARCSDYDHLLTTIAGFSVSPDEEIGD